MIINDDGVPPAAWGVPLGVPPAADDVRPASRRRDAKTAPGGTTQLLITHYSLLITHYSLIINH